jgi:hypothetical protein
MQIKMCKNAQILKIPPAGHSRALFFVEERGQTTTG